MRNVTTLKRRIAALVLLAFTSLTLQPLQAVAQAKLAQAKATPTTPPSDDEQYAKLLDDIKDTAKRGADKGRQGQKTRDEAKTLRQQKRQLEALETKVDDAFAATEAELQAKHLPPEILNRHRNAVADYKAKQTEFKRQLKTLEDADDKEDEPGRANGITSLSTWLEQNQKGKPHTPTDPHKLPFRTPDSKVRPPIESEAGYQGKLGLFGVKPLHLAGPIPAGTRLLPQAAPDPYAPPGAADLAETEDIQLTPAIRAQAAELLDNPVKIHNWVRNNIEYLPTYGSIQGSDMTLQTKRGNAFDSASLEIALLRAAGIPARYVYGAIELPAAQAMNWVGGVTKPEAALNLLGQGGIPSIGLVSGGQISHIKLEHVWVEAYVDYVPSRGAVNKTPDTWIQLDPSYKQYQYSQGMDIKNAVPLDAASLLTQAQSGATVNQAEGWVQNLNQANIQSALTSYQAQVKNYIDSSKPNATVGDVLGTKTIVQKNYSILMGSLPYKTLAIGSRMSALPDSLRHKFKYSLYASDYDRALESPVFSYTQSLPKLAGKKVTLSYSPASQADADLIASYLPKPHADGSPIQPSEFPTSLPGYLIHLKPELRVEGQVVATGGVFTMGTALVGEGGFTQFDFSGWDLSTDGTLVAGQTSAIGLSLQGISQGQLDVLKARMEATKAKLDTKDVAGLTGDHISGDILTANVWSYFASVQSFGHVARQPANMIDIPGLSYGLFHAVAAPNMFFGIPTSVKFLGVLMDIGHMRHGRVAKDGDIQTWIDYNRMRGQQASAMEGMVPAQFFADPNTETKLEGISAVKSIALAASQGQKIFTITQSNAATSLPQLSHRASVMEEVQNAINSGKEVTISQSAVTVGGWAGSGYIIIDPDTGAGAYMIEGGARGGAFDDGYATRYLNWVSSNLITLDSPAITSLLLLIAPVMKYWFGFSPVLGSSNPATTLIRALSLILFGRGSATAAAGTVGRLLWPVAVFVGFYNVTILIQGFFYAKGDQENELFADIRRC